MSDFGDRPDFETWLLGIAKAGSERSRDPSTKVGAVIVRKDKSIASIGYNGFPRGMEDKTEWYLDRPEKYARVVHAEMNALLSMKEHAAGCTIAITHPPCPECAKLIAASGIVKVIWKHCPMIEVRFQTGTSETIFLDSGVEFVKK